MDREREDEKRAKFDILRILDDADEPMTLGRITLILNLIYDLCNAQPGLYEDWCQRKLRILYNEDTEAIFTLPPK